jgi:hypothetical protein
MPVRDLTQAQLYAADISITERDGELTFVDEFTSRQMDPAELVSVLGPEPEPEAELEAG